MINRYTVIAGAFLIVIVTAFAVVAARNMAPETVAPQKTVSTQQANSQFSFIGTPGWRQGPTNETSMALFHGRDCFVSIEHKMGVVDVTAELEKIQTDLVSMDYTSMSSAIFPVTIQSTQGEKQYQLHQYSVMGSGSAGKIKGGQEYGYLQLSDGYLEIEGYCDTADQLPVTVDALETITYSPVD